MNYHEEQLLKKMAMYKQYPEVWIQEVFHEKLTDQQATALRAIAQPDSHTAIKSGHGCGKSAIASLATLHTLFFWDNVKVPITAPTGNQVRDIIFAEIRKWLGKCDPWWANQIMVTRERVAWVNQSGKQGSREALCRTVRKEQKEALAGIHEDNVLYIVEEASGCDEIIFPTIEGALSTKGSRILMISNPTRTEGYFHRAFTEDADEWNHLTFNAEESPLVSDKHIEKMRREYGQDSDEYRIRVLGEFPLSTHDVFMHRANVESMYYRVEDEDEMRRLRNSGARRVAALDVARFGDDANCLIVRQGLLTDHIDSWRGLDTMQTSGKVRDAWKTGLFDVVYVDAIGVGGGVADRLKEMGVPVVDVNVQSSSSSKDDFYRLRDELWFAAREHIDRLTCSVDRSKIDKDTFQLLAGELSMVRYDYMGSKLKIESKKDMKKRGVKSPNHADAYVMTFANEITGMAGVTHSASDKARPVDRTTPAAFLG